MTHPRPRLEAEPRQRLGTRYARRLRRAGKLPAVVYGHGLEPLHVAVDHDDLVHQIHEGAHLLELVHDGQTETCLIRDVQYDHLGTEVIHVDLSRIDMSEEVTVLVPIVVKGEDRAPGLKEAGAYLSQPLVDLEVTCRADAIPDELTVDIGALELHGSIHIGELTLPAGVSTEQDPEEVVVAIQVSRGAEEEEELAEAAEGAEPEVISERKEEEEEETGAEGKGEKRQREER